jgi:hypothetical protein
MADAAESFAMQYNPERAGRNLPATIGTLGS